MDRPGSQYTVVSYLITFWPLLFMWSYTGFSGLTVHPLALVAALALPATASGIASAAKPVRASKALRENDMGISNPSAGRRLSPASNRIYASTTPTGSRRRGAVLTLQCGNRDADAAPADLVLARPGLGRGHRRPADRAGPGSQRHVPPPVVHQAICRTGGCHAPAPGTARDHRAGGGRAGGHRGRQARAPRPAEPLPPAVPVRRRGAHHGTGLRDPPVPRRRVGGRSLPPWSSTSRCRPAVRCPPACTGT